ncbi:hypothetical protein [Sorangium sp. So ce362]|uniref:hypothetical protein n=1 Tax=Sorangium sp. So ce362 TaxID=3133303 RepID=UPI003F5E23A7
MACGGDDETSAGAGGTAGGSSSTTGGGNTGGSGGAGSGSGGDAAGGGGTERKRVGDPCTDDAQCPSFGNLEGYCLTSWPGGSCATDHCDGDLVCPPDSTCGVADGVARCLHFCFTDANCRDGYRCDTAEQSCVPAD